MEKSKVVLVPCSSYDEEAVYKALSAGINAAGGLHSFVSPEEKILIKPNFLAPSEAEKAITTHPSVIKAMCRILSEGGCRNAGVGDSPGGGSSKAAMNKLHLSEDELYGVRMLAMSEETVVHFDAGKVCKDFHFCREVAEADAIIGLCKMKTHMLERITGGVKNMYGLICGKRKAAGHVSYPTAVSFAKYLTDIHRATPQRLQVMDAITAMEGNGPGSGTPTHMGLILVSSDPVAMDTVFCWLVNLAPELVPTNIQGELAGIGYFHEENIQTVLAENGSVQELTRKQAIERFGKPEFDVQREKEKLNPLSFLSRIAGGSRRPVIDPSKCVKCGICVDHCPVDGKAVNFTEGREKPPVYNYHKCIRCYCCQELCPQKAISVKK